MTVFEPRIAIASAAILLASAFALPAAAQSSSGGDTATAIFAGGCFWCVESDFDKVPGVRETISGYVGGTTPNPTYSNYSAGGHREAVKITYDPNTVTYAQLVEALLHSIDVTDDGGQFCDRGFGYTSAIYPVDEEQATTAKAEVAAAQQELGEPIVTPVEQPIEIGSFTAAEDYHQNYYQSDDFRVSPGGLTAAAAYDYYRAACGRDDRVRAVWGDAAFRGIPGLSS